MSVAESETTSLPPPANASPARPPRRRWRRWALAAVVLACAILGMLATAAAHYQPLRIDVGNKLIQAFPGIPTGSGIRWVNNLGGFHEDIFIPPQRGTFAIAAIIENNGSHPVTIVAAAPEGDKLSLAGPVRYYTAGVHGGPGTTQVPASKVLHNAVLAPGQVMFLGLPVRMPWPCAQSNGGFVHVTHVVVTTRYLFFTHTVQLPWAFQGDSLIMRWPGGKPKPGQKGAICAPGTTLANLP